MIRLHVSLQLSDDNNLLPPLTLVILSSVELWDLLASTLGIYGTPTAWVLISYLVFFLDTGVDAVRLLA